MTRLVQVLVVFWGILLMARDDNPMSVVQAFTIPYYRQSRCNGYCLGPKWTVRSSTTHGSDGDDVGDSDQEWIAKDGHDDYKDDDYDHINDDKETYTFDDWDEARLQEQISRIKQDINEIKESIAATKHERIRGNCDYIVTLTDEINLAKACVAMLEDHVALQAKLEMFPLMMMAICPAEPFEINRKELIKCIKENEQDLAKWEQFPRSDKDLIHNLDKRETRLLKQLDRAEARLKKMVKILRAWTPWDKNAGLFYVKESHPVEFTTNGEHSSINNYFHEEDKSHAPALKRFEIEEDPYCEPYTACKELDQAWRLVNDKDMSNVDFINKLALQLPELDERTVRLGWYLFQAEFPYHNVDLMAETTLQQLVYSPFWYLLAAASGPNLELYRADTTMTSTSSLSVWYKTKEGDTPPQEARLTIKVHAAVGLYHDGWDPFGTLEIQPGHDYYINNDDIGKPCNDSHNLNDYEKCCLMTCITAIAIQRCMMIKNDTRYDQVAIPFMIAKGGTCSLYVTTLDDQGIPRTQFVEYPSGRNSRENRFDSASCLARKEMFTAFAVLLNKFKTFFKEYEQIYNDQLSDRKNAVLDLASFPPRTYRKVEAQMALEAATCGDRFVDVGFPFVRNMYFTDDGIVDELQTSSPFFFVGSSKSLIPGMKSKNVFLKVWKAEDVDSRVVELECLHHERAFKAGVPVAPPVLSDIARSTSSSGKEYLVMAVEYIPHGPFARVEDVVKFCRSLIESVELLHSEAQLLHCDLKPDTIRWNDGVVRLVDFGRAQPFLNATSVRGSHGDEAPEIVNGMSCSTKSDAFVVGRIMLECLKRAKFKLQLNTYNTLHDIASMLTQSDPESRWSLVQALEKVQTVEADMG